MRLASVLRVVVVLAWAASPAFASPDGDLLEAAEKGEFARVHAALAQGASVDAKAEDGTTALMLAAAANNLGLANLLVAKGAKVAAADREGVTALHVAVDRGNQGIAQLLVFKGADVNAKEKNGRTPLVIAADRGKALVVRLLLDHKADPNARANDGRTPLLHAMNNENFDVVKMLVAKGADVNAADANGHTALELGAKGCQPDPQELKGEKSLRPGHAKACPKDLLATLKLLVDKGADVNARTTDGFSPILSAMDGEQREIAKLILPKKPDLSGTLKGKRTALMLACVKGWADVVKLMLETGSADLNAKDSGGSTAFRSALPNGHKDCVDLLRKAGAKE
jgi:uncharacterized protein